MMHRANPVPEDHRAFNLPGHPAAASGAAADSTGIARPVAPPLRGWQLRPARRTALAVRVLAAVVLGGGGVWLVTGVVGWWEPTPAPVGSPGRAAGVVRVGQRGAGR
jgi:hypothetical protein